MANFKNYKKSFFLIFAAIWISAIVLFASEHIFLYENIWNSFALLYGTDAALFTAIVLLPTVIITIVSHTRNKLGDSKLKDILSALLISVVLTFIFSIFPVENPDTCTPNPSPLDPSGFYYNYLETHSPGYERILIPCGFALTNYTNPLFYFFFDLSVLLFITYHLRKKFLSQELQEKVYKIYIRAIIAVLVFLGFSTSIFLLSLLDSFL